jgi:hypothetical protein
MLSGASVHATVRDMKSRGRPIQFEGGMTQMSCNLPKHDADRLREMSSSTGIPRNELVRRSVALFLVANERARTLPKG